MMMRVNTNTVSAARVGTKTGAMPVLAPRRVVSVAAAKDSKDQAASASLQGSLAAVSAFCLGVSLLVSPVQPALAVLPPDNGAGLIKSFENAIPQPLNSKKESAAAYKDPAVEAKKDTAQYSDVDYTKKASDAIKGGVQNIKEAVTGAADSAKDNASDAASDIKVNANKLSNKVAYIGTGDRAADKISEGSKDLADNAKSANAFLAGKANKAVKNVKEATGNAVEGVKSGASNVSDKAENGFSKVDLSRVNLNAKQVAYNLDASEGAASKVADGAKDLASSGKQNAIKANAFLKNKASDVTDKASDITSAVTDKVLPNKGQYRYAIPGNAYLSGGKVNTVSNTRSPTSTDIPGNAYLQSRLGLEIKDKVDSDVQATKNTIKSVNDKGYTQAKEGVKDVLSNVANGGDNAKSVNAFIKDKAGEAKDRLSNKAQDLGDQAKDATRNVKYEAKDAANSVRSTGQTNQVNVGNNSNSTEIQGNAFLQSQLGRDVKAKVDGDVQATKNTASSINNNGLTQVKEGVKDAVDNASDGANAKGLNAFIAGKASAAKDAITDKLEDFGSAASDTSKNI